MRRVITLSRVINRELVMRLWRRLSAAHWAVRAGLVALLVCSALGSGVAVVVVSHAANSQRTSPQTGLDPKTLAQRYQLAHYGNRKPVAGTRASALKQAAQLPSLRWGGAKQVSGVSGTSPRLGSTGAGVWAPQGPRPFDGQDLAIPFAHSGQVNAMAVNSSNPNDIWIGSATGGLWHSTDGGQTWVPMTDNQPSLAIGSVVMEPANPTTIYAGTGDPNNIFGTPYPGVGILKTTDDGATWSILGANQFSGLAIGRMAIDPSNPQVILVAAGWDGTFTGNPDNTGIWRSADAGLTWTQVLSDASHPVFPDAGTDVVFDPADPSVAYAGLGNLYGLTPTTVSGVYKSVDNGITWTQITALPTGSDVERITLGISLDGTRLYAALTDGNFSGDPNRFFGDLLAGAVFTSLNSGTSWTPKPGPFAGQSFGHAWWRGSTLAVDPADPTGASAYVGSTGLNQCCSQLLRTANGGDTWLGVGSLTIGFGSGIVFGVAFPGSGPLSYYLATDDGLWGGTPTSITTDLNGLSNKGLGLATTESASFGPAGTHSRLYATALRFGEMRQSVNAADGAISWIQPLFLPGGASANTIVDYSNNANVYVENLNPLSVWYSGDGGLSWIDAFQAGGTGLDPADPSNLIRPLVLSPNNPAELFAATDRVWRSANRALSWTPISPALSPSPTCLTPHDAGCVPISALAVAPGNDQLIYTGNNNGEIFMTAIGGNAWQQVATPCSTCGAAVSSLAFDPTNPQVMYASLAGIALAPGTHIYKSLDGGASWTDISLTLPDASYVTLAVSPADHNLILAGSDIGAFASPDGGTTWERLGAGLPNVGVNQISTSRSGNDIVVATEGRGVWQLPYAHLGVSPTSLTQNLLLGEPVVSQTVTLANDAALAPYNWQLTSPLPSWLSISASSGTLAPGSSQQLALSYTIPSGVAGTFSTTLTFSDVTHSDATLAVPISVTISASHVLVSPGSISLTSQPGKSPASQSFTISNSGTIPLAWATQPLPAWLSLTPASGSVAPGASQSVRLDFHIPPIDGPQTYTTTIAFSDPHADDSPFNVPVTVVTAAPAKTWYFAEGTTNTGFTEFLTLANPGASLATVQVKYLLGSGVPVIKSYPVAAHSRATVNVNTELGPGQNVAMVVTSDQPLIAERPMFFTFRGTIPSGTDVLGATALAASFDFGYLDTTTTPTTTLTPATHSTWLVLLNQNAFAVDEHIAYFPAAGGPATVVTHTVPANSRGTVEVARDVPAGRYSALVTLTQSGTTITANGLVERVLYQVDSVTAFSGAAAIVGVPAPRSSFFFAEGFTAPGPNPRFSERYILSNPCPIPDCVGAASASVTLTFQKVDGSTVSKVVPLAPGQQQVVDAASVLGAGAVSNSATVTSDQPILAERFMSFRFAPAALGGLTTAGASEAIGAGAPSNLFYFAEGTTNPGFAEFLTIQNPDPTQTATVTVTLLPTTGAPVVKVLTVAPHSRFTLDVNSVLSGQSLSLVVESDIPIVAERPLYFLFRGTLPGGTDVVGYQP